MAEKNGATFLEVSLSFVIGAVVGAVVALLFAPAPGVETRRMLRERAEVLRDQVELAGARLRQKLRKGQGVYEEESEGGNDS